MTDPATAAAERFLRMHEQRDVPEGYELVAVPAPAWRLVSGKRCRRIGAGRTACTGDAVAELNRSAWRHAEKWWAYCPDHMYDKWVEGQRVMHWILREREPTP